MPIVIKNIFKKVGCREYVCGITEGGWVLESVCGWGLDYGEAGLTLRLTQVQGQRLRVRAS